MRDFGRAMLNKVRLICLSLLLSAGASGQALAHHSFAMFDMGKQVTLEGTVKNFKWSNPHAWIEINVPQEAGGEQLWGVELTSPNNLMRVGWKRTSLKSGDKVTIIVHPLRDGSPGGSLVQVKLVDGTILKQQ